MATLPIFNNQVRTYITYGDTAYAGGTFTTVNGVSGYTGLAKFSLSTGVADTTWKPAGGNTPFALALSPDGTAIFVGGTSTGQYLRKYLVNSNTLQPFVTTNDIVNGLIMDGNNLYVFKQTFGAGSTATSLQGTVSRPGCVKIDITGNSGQGFIDTQFVQTASSNTGTVFYNAVAQDSNYIYLGGNFTKWDNQTANYIVKINKSDAKIASDWAGGTGFNGQVYALLLGSNNSLYASASTFTTYKGVNTSGQIVKLDKQGTRDTGYTSFTVTGGVTTLAEYNSTIIAGTQYNTATSWAPGVIKSTNLSTFTKDNSFASTGFGTTGRLGYVNLVANNLFLSASATTSYQGSAAGFSWAISTATAVETTLIPNDIIAPTVALSSPVTNGSTTATNPIAMTATFSENVTGFISGNLSLTNCAVSGFSGSGSIYTFNVIPSGQGAVSVTVPAGAAVDGGNNGNIASSAYSFTYDSIRPSVSLTSPVASGSITAINPIAMTATFSESVTGFVSGNLSLVNCTVSSFSGSGTTYTFNLIPSGQGAMSVTVPAGAAADPAGNTNTASAAYSFTYDSVSPTTILTSSTVANAGSTNSSAVLMSATFSESVTGLVVGALSLTNCTVASISGSGSSYSFTVVPSGQGAVSVSIPAGVAQDSAGNSNLVSNTYSFTYDTVSPTVAVTSPNVAYSANSEDASVNMSFTFSESVTGFSASTLTLTNCSVSSFSGSGSSYSAVITPTAPGLVQVTVTTAQDAAGNFLVGPGQLFSYFKIVPAIVSQTTVARNQLLDMALSTPALVSVSTVPLIQWKRVLAVYTSPGKKTVVASFKFAAGVAAPGRFLARITGPASYLLSKMIIIKIGGQGVVVQRADFPTVSGMDINVT